MVLARHGWLLSRPQVVAERGSRLLWLLSRPRVVAESGHGWLLRAATARLLRGSRAWGAASRARRVAARPRGRARGGRSPERRSVAQTGRWEQDASRA